MSLTACLAQVAILATGQTPDWAKFNVAWRPEAEAPFARIRQEVEPYALSKSTTYAWTKSKADAASAAWKKDPKSAPALYRALLWERVLRTSHFSEVTPKDGDRREALSKALRQWEKIPNSFEFSRIVTSTVVAEELGPLAKRVWSRSPKDGLHLCWAFENLRSNVLTKREADALGKLAQSMYSEHSLIWYARRTWALSPWVYTDGTRIQDMPGLLRQVESRFLVLRESGSLGQVESTIVDDWLKRLARHIPGYEKVIRDGRGSERAYKWQG